VPARNIFHNAIKDIRPGRDSAFLNNLTEFNDKLYFSANDGVNGYELWVSDGTTAGTQLVANIGPTITLNSSARYFTESNDKLYFAASSIGDDGYELWITYGTTEGTQLVKDILPGSLGSNPKDLIEFNGELYFTANDGVNSRERSLHLRFCPNLITL
jgi:ELWxxDGT repeat protein